MSEHDRTASLMSPGKFARMKPGPTASPGAWLDQMAADVGRLQVSNLVERQHALDLQPQRRDLMPLAAALRALAEALSQLDFALLESRGWLARATGKARSAGAEFSARADRIGAAMVTLSQEAVAVQKDHAAGTAATERTLVDMEVEQRALDSIVEQGAKWLQDMRNQLKQRHAAAAEDPTAQQQVREDAARCEILVIRLKALRSLGLAARQAIGQTHQALAVRGELLQTLGRAVPAAFRGWEGRVSSLAASAAGDAAGPALSVEAPMEIHQQLRHLVDQTQAHCARLQQVEDALASQLIDLRRQLDLVLQG